MEHTEIRVRTTAHSQMTDISDKVREVIKSSGVSEGICIVFVPHTTAAVTINENADPDVKHDMITELDKLVPWDDGYRHYEGNSAAHLKSSMMGSSETVIVENNEPVLGTWQCIYFCEFDGPRDRRVLVKVIEDTGGSAK